MKLQVKTFHPKVVEVMGMMMVIIVVFVDLFVVDLINNWNTEVKI
jgi:hypothetical protein